MSTTAAAETTTAATAAAALFLWTGFVHHKIAATKVLAVQGVDRSVGFFVIVDFDESETARLARKTVTDEVNCRRVDT
jgi:hypothetical protein